MKKVVIIVCLCVTAFHTAEAQSFSLSANYLFIGPRDKYAYNIPHGLINHGTGIQSKIRLKNRLYLTPDVGYFFDMYRTDKVSEETSYSERTIRYYTANLNLAYDIRPAESLSLLPFAGVGFLYEYTQQILHYRWNGGHEAGLPQFGNADSYYAYDYPIIALNFGVSAEYRLDRHIFLTMGVKYLFDFYDVKKSSFPCLNVGAGYNF